MTKVMRSKNRIEALDTKPLRSCLRLNFGGNGWQTEFPTQAINTWKSKTRWPIGLRCRLQSTLKSIFLI